MARDDDGAAHPRALLLPCDGTKPRMVALTTDPTGSTLLALQRLVGGYIESIPLDYLPPDCDAEGIGLIGNEEARLDGLPRNPWTKVLLAHDGEEWDVRGPVVITACDDDGRTCDLPPDAPACRPFLPAASCR